MSHCWRSILSRAKCSIKVSGYIQVLLNKNKKARKEVATRLEVCHEDMDMRDYAAGMGVVSLRGERVGKGCLYRVAPATKKQEK